MPRVLQDILIWSYFIPTAILMLFGLNLYVLLALSLRRAKQARREVRDIEAAFAPASLPPVTTQIPLYNEFNVAERCLRACAAMDYPRGLHTVQVLDDSDDETCALVDRVAAELRAAGHQIQVLRRPTREGYKAGALDNGMRQSPDAFFAIFDADFVPPPDFLRRTMAVMLARPSVGLVQARWGHLNASENLLTQAQSIGIDGHFYVEQTARAWNRLIMNFNGTAGLWRRQAVEAAAGWQHDTLTEDLDLSYRAQLAGWKPFYLVDLVVPAEVPANIHAFKSQQFRWAKGSIETALKLLPRILHAPVRPAVKMQAALHLTHYLIHPFMLWHALMALPLLLFTWLRDFPAQLSLIVAVILTATLAPTTLYAVSQTQLYPRHPRRLLLLPLLSVLGVGIAISNTRAVLQALCKRKSAFVRTPKAGDQQKLHYQVRLPRLALAELLLGFYCLGTAIVYAQHQWYWVIPFLLLYGVGFLYVGGLSLARQIPPRARSA